MRRQTILGTLTVISLLLTGACGDDSDAGPGHDDDHSHGHPTAGMDVTYAFGEPGLLEDVDREVEIEASDPFAFDPDKLKAAAGDTITFVVTNNGNSEHEFVLGDPAYQESYDEGQHGPNGVHLVPGATGELTWTFTSAGEVEFACHVADHYEAGMVGTIEIR